MDFNDEDLFINLLAMIISIVALLASSATPSPSPGVDILSTVFEEGLGNISCKNITYIYITSLYPDSLSGWLFHP